MEHLSKPMKTVKSTSFAMLLKRKKKIKKGKILSKNTKLDLSSCQNAVAMAMPNGVGKQLIHHNVSKESCRGKSSFENCWCHGTHLLVLPRIKNNFYPIEKVPFRSYAE